MQTKLYDIYNPDRDEDGVQFEQFGAGNNIRVVLPDGDTEDFTLGGGGLTMTVGAGAMTLFIAGLSLGLTRGI